MSIRAGHYPFPGPVLMRFRGGQTGGGGGGGRLKFSYVTRGEITRTGGEVARRGKKECGL